MSNLVTLALAALLAPQDTHQRPELAAPIVLRGATVVTAPGQSLDGATLVIEDGRITAVAKDAAIPAGAREIDAAGMYAYAGFIDGFTRTGVSDQKPSAAEERRVEDEFESASEGPRVRSELANRNGIFARRRVEDLLDIQDRTFVSARNAGFATALIAPPQGIIGGLAAALSLGDRPLRRSVLAGELAQTASFSPPAPRSLAARDRYPSTALAVAAHFRQTMMDAQWYAQMREYAGRHPEARRELPYDRDLDALQDLFSGNVPLFWEVNGFDEIHRALDLAAEFKLKVAIVGGRDAFKLADRLKRENVSVILTPALPKKPEAFKLEPEKWRAAGDDKSRAGASAGPGLTSVLPSNWEKRPFLPKEAYEEAKRIRDEEVRNALELEKAGVRWCISTYGQTKPTDALTAVREMIEAGLPADAALKALTVTPAAILKLDAQLGTIEKGKRGTIAIFSKPLADKDAQVRWLIIDGQPHEYDAFADRGRRGRDRGGADREKSTTEGKKEGDAAAEPSAESKPAPTTAESRPPTPLDELVAHTPSWPIETPKDRDPGLRTGGNVLLKGATILPISGDDARDTSILVENGKIKAIGRDLSAPPGVTTIDLNGYTIMPGIIDPHSHIALDAVNEFSLSVVPEVRCADVVDSEDIDIYRALAGGVTTIHAMHGSANTIGGQNVVLKLKYGKPAAEMIVLDATRTVKFATGENVKRSGMPTPRRLGPADTERVRRFPGSRMGVEAVMRRALQTGREYDEQRSAAKSGDGKPLRRDLRQEALADIYRGDIWINCHCYRADEILRLLGVAEDFGVRVATLHHCLEAYRIMPEIARHGAGTATFADWWAYKVEAYDAVPHNAGMLLRYGVNSTLKSDSSDLMRHMNVEAAKAVRFSGLSSREALTIITLNAARLFGLDGRIGSIEVGKDADLAVFDGHPLDTFGRCVLTLVEGEVYFRHRDFDATRPPPARTAPLAFDAKRDTAPAAQLVAHRPGTNGATNGNPTAAPSGIYAIKGATIHPVSSPAIENGTLVMRSGKIEAVGATAAIPDGATVIDGRGLHVWPGVIAAASAVGMQEIGAVDVTIDTSETGLYMPDLTSVSALNPHSAMIEVARAEGITTTLLTPAGSRIAGQAGLVHLDGWTTGEMLHDAKVGLVVTLPQRTPEPILDRKPPPDREREFEEARAKEREEEQAARELRELEQFLRDAQLYARRASGDGQSSGDPRFEAMVPYILGKKPVLFNADSYKAILEALIFAEQFGLRPVLVGGRDAWKLADVLAARKVPVIYTGIFAAPSGVEALPGISEAWDANYRAAGVLAAAGVAFCLANRDAALAKNVLNEAGFAVAHGLNPDAAVRALTLAPAEILGVADRLGSLEPGKVANVVVTTGHLCQTTSTVRHVFVRGRQIPQESKHTRESDKFAHRPSPELPPARSDLRGPRSLTTR